MKHTVVHSILWHQINRKRLFNPVSIITNNYTVAAHALLKHMFSLEFLISTIIAQIGTETRERIPTGTKMSWLKLQISLLQIGIFKWPSAMYRLPFCLFTMQVHMICIPIWWAKMDTMSHECSAAVIFAAVFASVSWLVYAACVSIDFINSFCSKSTDSINLNSFCLKFPSLTYIIYLSPFVPSPRSDYWTVGSIKAQLFDLIDYSVGNESHISQIPVESSRISFATMSDFSKW